MRSLCDLRIVVSVLGFALATGMVLVAQQPEVESTELPSQPLGTLSEALASFEVAKGFRIEPVASEPLVMDPVAMSFDEWGRLYVVEMRDYSERRPARLGRVRCLEDKDGDGVMDQSTVFVDGLPWPTAVICYDGGIFVGSTPDIYYFKDEDGDGTADLRRKVFTGFAIDYAPYETNRLNVQALMNSFRWGIDNRIHGVASGVGGSIRREGDAKVVSVRGRDFSFDPRHLDLRPESGGAQHGMSFDDVGQKYVCSNSDHIQQVVYADRYAGLNPRLPSRGPRVSIAEDGPAAPVFRLSPDEPWRVIRTKWRVAGRVGGPVEGGGRPSGYFTGATGVTIFRGDQWPQRHRGQALIADCGSNLIHRKWLQRDQVIHSARRYQEDERSEFVASSSNWFRPVQFANAPDGTIWVADMSREVIEHPWSLPENIKQHLDLNNGHDAGRIYRLVATDRPVNYYRPMGGLDAVALAEALKHPNGWHRDTASRLLIESGDRRAEGPLRAVLETAPEDYSRIHALRLLQSLGWLQKRDLRVALTNQRPWVRVHGLRVLEDLDGAWVRELSPLVRSLRQDSDVRVAHQLALSLGLLRYDGWQDDLYAEILKIPRDPWLRHALLNSMGQDINGIWQRIVDDFGLWTAAERRADLLAITAMMAPELGGAGRTEALRRMASVSEDRLAIRGVLTLLGGADLRDDAERRACRGAVLPAVALARRAVAGENTPLVGEALEMLGRLGVAGSWDLLKRILSDAPSSSRVLPGLRASEWIDDPEMLPWLTERFSQFLPGARREIVKLVYARSTDLSVVLDWIEAKLLATRELTDRQRSRLLNHSVEEFRLRAQRLLVRSEGEREAELARLLPALLAGSDIEAGKRVFLERCATCHRADDVGVAVGPDVASMRGLRKRGLLEAVLNPNREVAPQYFSHVVIGEDEEVTGIIVRESEVSITLRQSGGLEATLLKESLGAIQSEGLSLMPEGLLESLSSQEVGDLLEFLMYYGGTQ